MGWMSRVAFVFVLVSGCTHHQLRFNTVHQARTVADIHTKQVLDNLAKFAHDPHALPHFSYPKGGLAQVTDTAGSDGRWSFLPNTFDGWYFGIKGERRNNESYDLVPINDAQKLTLMRCAYQRAVSGCCGRLESCHCPDCEKLFNKFYLGRENPKQTSELTADGKPIYRVQQDVQLIHYPEPGRYVNIPRYPNVYHFVVKDYDEVGHVIYTYERSETSSEPHSVFQEITPGTRVFKIANVALQTKSEADSFLKGFSESTTFFPAQASGRLTVSENVIPRTITTIDDFQRLKGSLVDQGERTFVKTEDTELDGTSLIPIEIDIQIPLPKALESKDLASPQIPNTLALATERRGNVTPACLDGQCWFEVGKQRDVPKGCPHAYVGNYCGTYVWVPPCGRDQLTKLTLAILDIVSSDPPSSATSDVYAFIAKDGKTATTYEQAAFLAKAKVRRGGSVTSILPGSSTTVEPPSSEAIKPAVIARKNLREDFVQALFALTRETKKSVYQYIAELPEELRTATVVDYVDQYFLAKSVKVEDGDMLIPLAAAVLGRQEPFHDEPDPLMRDVRRTANSFLNAEQFLQSLDVSAKVSRSDLDVAPTRTNLNAAGSEVFNLNQRLQSLLFNE